MAEVSGCQLRKGERPVPDLEPVLRAMRGEKQHQHVVGGVHAGRERLERLGEPRDARERIGLAVLDVVHEQHRAVAGAKALGEHLAREQRLAAEYPLLAIARKADEVHPRRAGPGARHARDCGGDLGRLLIEERLGLGFLIRLLGLCRLVLLDDPESGVEIQHPDRPGRGEHQDDRHDRRAHTHRTERRPEHPHGEETRINECHDERRPGPRLHGRPIRGEPEDREHERGYGKRGHQERPRAGVAALGARHEGPGGEAQQQVAGPAEQPVEGERRMGLRMQEIERGPQGEIHREKGGDLVEADRELRRPAPAQRQQLEAAREVVLEGRKEPRRRSLGGRGRRGDRMIG